MDVVYTVDQSINKFRIFRSQLPPSLGFNSSPLHKHEYAEVHLVADGWIRCTVEGEEYVLNRGDVLLIPRKAFHRILDGEPNGQHFAFQAELNSSSVIKEYFSAELLHELFRKMRSGDHGITTLAYICNSLTGIVSYTMAENRDYKHEIGHFFDKRHNENVEVKHLANELHLSEMQTQRLVKKYTGMTFGENLRSYRMNVANYLAETTDMSLEEIAREVGYASYSGFWKARQKSIRKNND